METRQEKDKYDAAIPKYGKRCDRCFAETDRYSIICGEVWCYTCIDEFLPITKQTL